MLSPVFPPEIERLMGRVVKQIDGAVQITADCGHQAWISPSGLRLTLALPHRTICLACVNRDGVPADADLQIAPGSEDEAIAAMGEESYRSALALSNKWLDRKRRRR